MKHITYFTLPMLITLFSAGCKESKSYDATGIFEATTVTVSAEVPGKILSMTPVEGDTVEAGELIGVIDTTTLVLQLKQLQRQQGAIESNSPDVSAQAAALRSQIDHARSEAERVDRLYADNAATQKQRDDARSQVKILRDQLAALLSSLDKNRNAISDNALALQYQCEQVESQIAKSSVTSPLSGTILAKCAQQGEFATVGKPLYKIANLNDIYLRAYFTSAQLADLRIGEKVRVVADFGGDKRYEYPGTVSWIAQESEFTPKSIQTKDSRANLVYAVKIAVANDGRLKLGQYGEVYLK